jgi:hypothetical protein
VVSRFPHPPVNCHFHCSSVNCHHHFSHTISSYPTSDYNGMLLYHPCPLHSSLKIAGCSNDLFVLSLSCQVSPTKAPTGGSTVCNPWYDSLAIAFLSSLSLCTPLMLNQPTLFIPMTSLIIKVSPTKNPTVCYCIIPKLSIHHLRLHDVLMISLFYHCHIRSHPRRFLRYDSLAFTFR